MKLNKLDSWNAHLYDEKHEFVSRFGKDLIDLLAPMKGERILDIGCGTGDLAYELDNLQIDIVGVDKSANMINQAIAKYPHITFQVDDVTDLKYQNEFDAVFSNATLHWVKSPGRALNCIYNSLDSGGRFVAELGGKGNVKLITDEIIKQLDILGTDYNPGNFPWYFPSIAEYSTLMEEAGFRVVFAQHFDRPTPLEGKNGLKTWIEMFAGSMFGEQADDTKELVVTKVENNLKEFLYKDGSWFADYKRVRVVGIKD
ncbi:class I SAM-dependent methyltransferase [Aquibacillus rhizosphaerae]|uniref:Methyltransferase domain-containing protein n=1 Tax=Aquibacillus rhizosphaerae TaxID=3051431 RepID=A0ABT7L5I1_9BACI|nr:class I SAM-dependent methyltransferase [Aquibacillus sp. LR5S19]MDL4841110.1 methyltransferase domain-containing protein [Aquibacillus sp. LR5S19]